MGYGEVWWFLRDEGPESLDGAVVSLRDAGFILGHPVTGIPQEINSDGEQVPWVNADVKKRWTIGNTITAQFWLSRETDVLVELVRPRQLITFDLDGMTAAEARRTVFAVVNAALSLSGTRAVVVGRELPDHGDDLLAEVARFSSKVDLPFVPALLVLPKGVGNYSVVVREGSWLAKPPALVQSFE